MLSATRARARASERQQASCRPSRADRGRAARARAGAGALEAASTRRKQATLGPQRIVVSKPAGRASDEYAASRLRSLCARSPSFCCCTRTKRLRPLPSAALDDYSRAAADVARSLVDILPSTRFRRVTKTALRVKKVSSWLLKKKTRFEARARAAQ